MLLSQGWMNAQMFRTKLSGELSAVGHTVNSMKPVLCQNLWFFCFRKLILLLKKKKNLKFLPFLNLYDTLC